MPVHLRAGNPISDEQLLRFCSENELLRVERDANGELIIMSPTGTDGGGTELEVGTELNLWARQDGRGKALGPNAGVKTAGHIGPCRRRGDERYNAASWERVYTRHRGGDTSRLCRSS